MHKQNLVVSVQSNKTNKFYRESAGKVFVPFSDEYSIYIKNLDTRRAVLDITVDGQRPRRCRFVLDGKEEFTLKSDERDHAFRFIAKTDAIIRHRGDRPEDGLISVTFQFERAVPTYHHPWPWDVYMPPWENGNSTGRPIRKDIRLGSNSVLRSTSGITVAGSEIRQRFNSTEIRELEDGATITLELVGETPTGRPVTRKHTSRSKLDCPTCGRVNSAASNYCIECGTALW